VLHPGDQLWEYIAGGAGYGDPLERDPGQVLADVQDRKVSLVSARETYGVVLTPEGDAVDELGTKECREALRGRRGPITWTFDRGIDGRDEGNAR
jgi:N-methylhydantoinase B